MRLSLSQVALALVGVAQAQRPSDTSICDYYTKALLKENTAENQYTLLTLVVNTAVIGNYTKPNVGIKVPGILAPGMYNGKEVNLVPYFSGALASSNRGGKTGVSVNFLDDGGAAPLEMNKPANGTSSNQYKLLTHLYEFFGPLLGCSQYSKSGYPAYSGFTGMYEVHKFMALDASEVGYFIQQVGMSAASFGVTDDDVKAVGTALQGAFGQKCAAPAAVLPAAKKELQAICIANDCPLAPNATCSAYEAVIEPKNATMSSNASSSASGTASATGGAAGTSGSSTSSGSPAASSPGVTQSNSADRVGSAASGILAALVAVMLL